MDGVRVTKDVNKWIKVFQALVALIEPRPDKDEPEKLPAPSVIDTTSVEVK